MFSTLKNRAIAYVLIMILSVFIANVEPYFSIEDINSYIEQKLYEQQHANDIYAAVTSGMKKDKRGLISQEDENIIMGSDLSKEEKNAFTIVSFAKKNNLKPVSGEGLRVFYKEKITNKRNQSLEVAQSVILLMFVIASLDGILNWLSTFKAAPIAYTKSTVILLESACLVWVLIAWILFRRNIEPFIVFGFIPIILANGWFFFKYLKNQEKDKIE